jgi:GNAT superfamily N-acetyltransferase
MKANNIEVASTAGETVTARVYRGALRSDITEMAAIRVADWGTEEYWTERIFAYKAGQLHPGEALPPRAVFVCEEQERLVGLIAGHLTRRFGCDGELEWISVKPECRNRGIASQLLRCLAEWFIAQNATLVCVDVEPSSHGARQFYFRNGAEDLKPHWMVWRNIGAVLEHRCGE